MPFVLRCHIARALLAGAMLLCASLVSADASLESKIQESKAQDSASMDSASPESTESKSTTQTLALQNQSTDPVKSSLDESDIFPAPKSEKKRKRRESAQNSYEYYMRLLEHEGLYFMLLQSFPPYNVYGNHLNTEFKFQISLKMPLWRGAFWTKGTLFFGYTQTSWFQQFNFKESSPIRETTTSQAFFTPILSS